jgi:DNA mismatch repair protein MutS2
VRVLRDGKVVNEASVRKETAAAQAQAESNVQDLSQSRELRVGDRVKLRSFGTIGVIDRLKGNEAEVRVGSLHMREKLENLVLVDSRSSSPAARKDSLEKMGRRAATELHLHSRIPDSKFQNQKELNLIGKTTDEAVGIVDRFLDEAFLNGQNEVRIIHGHGTGALRKAVTQFLSDHPHVARFSAAPPDQGGNGATVVELLT